MYKRGVHVIAQRQYVELDHARCKTLRQQSEARQRARRMNSADHSDSSRSDHDEKPTQRTGRRRLRREQSRQRPLTQGHNQKNETYRQHVELKQFTYHHLTPAKCASESSWHDSERVDNELYARTSVIVSYPCTVTA